MQSEQASHKSRKEAIKLLECQQLRKWERKQAKVREENSTGEEESKQKIANKKLQQC